MRGAARDRSQSGRPKNLNPKKCSEPSACVSPRERSRSGEPPSHSDLPNDLTLVAREQSQKMRRADIFSACSMFSSIDTAPNVKVAISKALTARTIIAHSSDDFIVNAQIKVWREPCLKLAFAVLNPPKNNH